MISGMANQKQWFYDNEEGDKSLPLGKKDRSSRLPHTGYSGNISVYDASHGTHIAAIVRSASCTLYMFCRLKSFGLPESELSAIFKLFVLPRLTCTSPPRSPSLNTAKINQKKSKREPSQSFLDPRTTALTAPSTPLASQT